MKHIAIAIGVFTLAGASAFAQKEPADVLFVAADNPAKVHVEAFGGEVGVVRFGTMGGPPIKGAPYSAEGVTEVNQTLADGTHIHRQENYTIYRDGEGRVRRENGGEAWISDPVMGVSYVLDIKNQIAHKMALTREIAYKKMQGAKLRAEAGARSAGFPGIATQKLAQPEKQESLGTQEMEGLAVEGKRSTTVIPKDQIGNDRPLEMVTERWESRELDITIMSKHTDPLMGDHVERLTNVRRGEPDPALFQVPANFQIDSDK